MVLVGCGDKTAAETLASAKASLAKGNIQTAIVEFKMALQQQPDSGEARFLLGNALLEGGNAELAYLELRKALDLKYASAKVVPQLAKSLLARQQYQMLVDQYANVDLGEPVATANLKTSLAEAFDSLGNAAQAQEKIRTALQLVPDYPPALLVQARILAASGKFDQALALAERLIATNQRDADSWFVKGVILLRGKADPTGAMEAFGKAIDLMPSHMLARSNLISLLLAKNDLPAAKSKIEELRKLVPKSPQIFFFDAQLALASGQPKVALQLIEQLVKSIPANPYVFEMAGVIQMENGLFPQAQRSLSRALDLSANMPVARQRLAQVFMKMGQPAKALDTLKPMLTDSTANAGAYALAGEANFRVKDFDLARTYFANAAKLDPANAAIRTSLALVNIKIVGIDATLKELRSIAALDKGTTADLTLVNLLAQQKDFTGALAAIKAIDQKLPKSPVAANLRGQIHLMDKDVAAARLDYARALEIDPLHVPSASMLATLDLVDRKPDAARKHFEKILAADPENYQATLEMAKMLAGSQGSKIETASLFAKAIKIGPTYEEPRLRLIDQYLAQRNFKSAMTTAADAVAALPDSTRLLDALGRSLIANGDVNRAINTFGKIVTLKPNSPDPYLRLAAAYLIGKNSAAAEKSLRQALTITPDLVPAQQALIKLMLSDKRYNDALLIARTVQKQRPASEMGFVMESGIEVARNNLPASIDVYRRALKTAPVTMIAIKYHDALLASNDKADADRMAEAWIQDHPKDPEFRFHLSDLAIARNNYEIALKQLRAVIVLQPENAAALNNAAWAMVKLGQPGAVRLAEQAVNLQPNTAGLMDTLAMALAAEKQLGRALEVQKKAIEFATPPNDQNLRLNLVRLHLQAGDKAAARAELQTLEKLGTGFANHAEVADLLKKL